jgi:upstream activation factor subunit UAF30
MTARNESAFNRLLPISLALAAIVGDGPLSRPEVTKRIWSYIKEHGLQDPANKRMIIADDKLLVIFNGRQSVSMFEMTALVNKHLS